MSAQNLNVNRRCWLKKAGTLAAGIVFSDMIFGQIALKKSNYFACIGMAGCEHW